MREAFQATYKADTAEEFERLLQEWHEWVSTCEIEAMVDVAAMIKGDLPVSLIDC